MMRKYGAGFGGGATGGPSGAGGFSYEDIMSQFGDGRRSGSGRGGEQFSGFGSFSDNFS